MKIRITPMVLPQRLKYVKLLLQNTGLSLVFFGIDAQLNINKVLFTEKPCKLS